MAAVYIDVHFGICNIYTIKNNLSPGGILHTVQAAQKRAFAGAGGSHHNHDISFVYRDADSFQNLIVPKMLFQINYVDHFSSGSFP